MTHIANLKDCTEFRQTLAARPPAIVHGAAILCMLFLATAVTWSAIVKANLVVKAKGRVRPLDIPTKIFTASSEQLERRVAAANFEEGDKVKKGDVLVRMETDQIDNRIAKLQGTIRTGEAELAEMARVDSLLTEQFDSAREKAHTELTQAKEQLEQARLRQASEVRRSQDAQKLADDQARRLKKLVQSGAVTPEELEKAQSACVEAEEKLVQSQLPLDERGPLLKQQALELVHRDYEVRHGEAAARRLVKQGEVAAARKELASLELQRQEATLHSPLDGIIIAGQIQPGDVLESGKAVMEIAPHQGLLFEAIVPSEDMGHITVDMPVRIKFDAYDYQKYGVLVGTVSYISPDSQIADKGQNKPVAGYLVRISLAASEVSRGKLRGEVKLGLGGVAEIVTARESILSIFLKKIQRTISLG
jgi:hemolysin D